jgi:hypothetical protein
LLPSYGKGAVGSLLSRID